MAEIVKSHDFTVVCRRKAYFKNLEAKVVDQISIDCLQFSSQGVYIIQKWILAEGYRNCQASYERHNNTKFDGDFVLSYILIYFNHSQLQSL